MRPDERFVGLPKPFWAYVRTLSETLKYVSTQSGYIKIPQYLIKSGAKNKRNSQIKVPTLDDVVGGLEDLGLSTEQVISRGGPTKFGTLLQEYFQYRADVLHEAEGKLMDALEAKKLYSEVAKASPPVSCPQPMNKQKGKKRAKAYLTCMVNLLIAANVGNHTCDYDPRELTKLTRDGKPFRTFARRVDGCFPGSIDPIAMWEIKEYYYTTTFGSRIADGVYETLLDGMEIEEAAGNGRDTKHYLFVDSYYTWWGCGKSYLCRIVDMVHMGYVDEVLFGREVVGRLPELVREWVAVAET